MSIFDELREDREFTVLVEPDRAEVWFDLCQECGPKFGLLNPFYWEDPYKRIHCALCDYPPTVAVVRRVLVVVPDSMPAGAVVQVPQGEPCSVVERSDWHARWARIERTKSSKEQSDGY